MMATFRALFLLGLAGTLSGISAGADVTVSPLFTHHAVLQRDVELPVWGTADPGQAVKITFDGQTLQTTADPSGNWTLKFRPIPGNRRGTLTITGGNTVVLTNLVTGDVWLCSGQSNMGFRVADAGDAEAEIAAADLPDIRQLQVPPRPSKEPQPDTFVKSTWVPASPVTAGNFTAAGFYFAREIHQRVKVPIGLINSSWGGTPIQPWMPLGSLQSWAGYSRLLADKEAEIAAWPAREKRILAGIQAWETKAATARAANQPVPTRPWNPGSPDSGQYMPANLYNGMINPIVRYQIKGMLWYQGESNAGGGESGAAEYIELQTRLVQSWRKAWGNEALPFYFVQLANYGNPSDASGMSWAFFREAQAELGRGPHTGMASAVDIGDTKDIHPKNKQEVGRRLALLALAGAYGFNVEAQNPTMIAAELSGEGVRVTFEHLAEGLVLKNAGLGFELAGADGKYHAASAKISQSSVVVSSPAVAHPVSVRYAWANDPKVSLFNSEGLPAVPFRASLK